MQRFESRDITRRNFLKGSALAAAGSILAACAPTAAPAEAPAADEAEAAAAPESMGGTLVFGYPQKTSYSDLLAVEHNAGNRNYYLMGLTHNALLTISADYTEWIPELAESWEFEGNTATFHLRQGVTWHDGEPFTSADVLFTFGRLVGHPNVNQWNGVRHFLDIVVGMTEFSEGDADEVVGLSAPDDYTFVFEMTNPYRGAFLEKLLYFAIMPKHLLSLIPEEQWGIDEQGQQGLKNTEYAKKQGTGTGPFRVSNYIPDQVVEYEPFEDYFKGKPLLDKAAFVPYTDQLAMAAAVEKGECHIAIRTPQSEFERFKAMDHVNIVLNPGPSAFAWYHNVRYVLNDKRVRQGLSLALNRPQIAKDFFFDTVGHIQASLEYGDYGISPGAAQWFEYNPERARQLLEEGGWDFDYTLRLGMSSLTPTYEPLYAMLREMWDAVGIKTEFQVMAAEYTNILNNPPWDFDTLFSGYGWGLTPGGFTHNFTGPRWGDPDLTGKAMIDEVILLDDEEAIKEGSLRLQEYASELQRHCVIAQVPGIHVVNNRVQMGDVVPVYGARTEWIDWVNVYMSA